ncbi:MAG: hypothetical protein M9954_12490 [Cyclobacteriaceae bacterium]|nr:hypothetical protein [Cyclobacteriaceae bacterium]MCB0500825.1 hypothetical protein [Cyclobacteriaceae bacterium]MCB9239204.1 hypothetical protein [Flammeovirgaceae bacterium]MCO5272470.1 hypothetical protein [Cyclobacteriaceae bacterium]MCW5903363.1 hypothetical protein [Cyclobacteriaceae bacterium]
MEILEKTPLAEYAVILIISLGAYVLISKKMANGFGPYNMKVYGITLVAILAAIIAVSNIDANKSSAAYGILGAIVGYLFGLKDSN